MQENKWTKANRLTEVIRHEIRKEIVGSLNTLVPPKDRLYSFSSSFEGIENGDSAWAVWATTRTGLDKEETGLNYFATENEAQEAVNSMPVGTVFGDRVGWPFRFKDMLKEHKNPSSPLTRLFSQGDDDVVDMVCYDAFFETGVTATRFGEPSAKVIDWLGEDHLLWMQEHFDEKWSIVGIFEYCLHHFPQSSLVSLAAKLFFQKFVGGDEFSVGYLVKEIQAISGGTEQAAISSVLAKKKAGVGGAQHSSTSRQTRLEQYMVAIEELGDLYPRISEEAILQQAFENAADKANRFWMVKRGQAEKYATALSSEEPFKSRYYAIFGKNA